MNFIGLISLVLSATMLVLLIVDLYLMASKQALPKRDMPENATLLDEPTYRTWAFKQYVISYSLLGLSAISNILDAVSDWRMSGSLAWLTQDRITGILLWAGVLWLFSISFRRKKFFAPSVTK